MSRRKLTKAMTILAAAAVLATAGMWFIVTQPLVGSSTMGGVPAVNPERLKTHTRVFSEDLVPRDWRHLENLNRAADYIRSQLAAAGGRTEDQAYQMGGQTYRNVIAVFGPDTGELPGADDNASAVAGLIELARVLGRTTPTLRVELVAFTLEEPKTLDPDALGLFRSEYGGSAVHAASLMNQGAEVRVAIIMEMIGYFSDEEGSQGYPASLVGLFYPSQGNFINIIGKLGQGDLVAWIIPKDALSSCFSTLGITWMPHKFNAARRHKFG